MRCSHIWLFCAAHRPYPVYNISCYSCTQQQYLGSWQSHAIVINDFSNRRRPTAISTVTTTDKGESSLSPRFLSLSLSVSHLSRNVFQLIILVWFNPPLTEISVVILVLWGGLTDPLRQRQLYSFAATTRYFALQLNIWYCGDIPDTCLHENYHKYFR